MHPSREVGRFDMDNLSSRPGDCNRYLDEKMAKSARYLPLANAAKVLGVTPDVIRQMTANGQIQTQQNGSVTEYRFDFDPDDAQKYTPVPETRRRELTLACSSRIQTSAH